MSSVQTLTPRFIPWARANVQSEATTGLFYSMIAELKRMADAARPTAFHHLLKMIDEQGRLLRVYTQNIDALEHKAGLTFGLGEVADNTSTMRALGKRKREQPGSAASSSSSTMAQEAPEPPTTASSLGAPSTTASLGGARRSYARCKSDSALLWTQRQAEQAPAATPMFPRAIPLHGSLHTLNCSICPYKMSLYPADELEVEVDAAAAAHTPAGSASTSPTPPHVPAASGSGSGSGATVQSPEEALQLLEAGEPIPCPRCEVASEVRTSAGLRARGVGRMKVDVVLYGGQNDGAERVGACVARDILGLRDPNEAAVPENARETQARERREKTLAAAAQQKEAAAKAAPPPPPAARSPTRSPFPKRQFLGTRSEASALKPRLSFNGAKDEPIDLTVSSDADDVFAAHFSTSDSEDNDNPSALATAMTTSSSTASVSQPAAKATAAKKKRVPLKPLPPDLLIVAGTSLKVPGTKRLVREFAKACKARDRRVYPSDDEEEESEDERASGRRSSSRRRKQQADDSSEEEEDEEEDPKAPIRTILLNYDFPIPHKEWEGVFDVWLQGDVQAAARGLAPTMDSAKDCGLTLTEQFQVSDRFRGEHAPKEDDSWLVYKQVLDEMRAAEKRAGKSRKSGGAAAAADNSINDVKMAERTTPKKKPAVTSKSPQRAAVAESKPAKTAASKGNAKITSVFKATVAGVKKASAAKALATSKGKK